MPPATERLPLLGGNQNSSARAPRQALFQKAKAHVVAGAALVGILLCIGGAGALIHARSRSHQPAAPVDDPTRINWKPCDHDASFQCGSFSVPLDHANPGGRTISIALIKYPAQSDKPVLGSLFTNPGGPGGSGVDLVKYGGKGISDNVDGRYDIIGFDPRGIGASNPIRCFDSAITHRAFDSVATERLISKPLTTNFSDPGTFEYAIAHEMARAEQCQQNAGYLLPFLSTAAVARDMDLLRRAERQERLHYWGFSYGTILGQTYINMFPDRVGHMPIDGVVNPVAWGEGWGFRAKPSTRDVQWLTHAQEVYEGFAEACEVAGPGRCALAVRDPPDEHYVAKRIEAFLGSLILKPLPVPFANTPGVVTRATVRQLLTDLVYQPKLWPKYAQAIHEAASLGNGTSIQNLIFRRPEEKCPLYDIPQGETFLGVACSDAAPRPYDAEALKKEVIAADEDYFVGGVMATMILIGCAHWPGVAAERYSGPWNPPATNSTVLVVGNLFDPVTPIESARLVHSLLPNSRLLEIHSYGHCSYTQPSKCVDKIIRNFFVNGHAPDASVTECSPDEPLFPVKRLSALGMEEESDKGVDDALNDIWTKSRMG
ncbi:hypothetical protein HDU88_000412 [Geranomyces variabilis]|nr:hypothetical protein HDU88_000412 [Geranomyces variabilis]